jgi:hypothetical protein
MEAFRNSSTPATSRWMYIVTVDQQLRKVRFTDSDSNIAVVARLRKVMEVDRAKLPITRRMISRALLMSKMVVGWIHLEEVSNQLRTSSIS